jgi:predicted dinucleotide-binding enzyme
MKIGIVGIGAIGGIIARRLKREGHDISVANSRGPRGAELFASAHGVRGTDVGGAIEGADAVVVSIPFPAVQNLPKQIFARLPAHVPVIDTGNYYPALRDPQIPEIDAGKVESVWVSEQLDRSVIKIFNTIIAPSLEEGARPKGAADRIALSVFGDDPRQKKVALGLVEQMGFDPLDCGRLEESWRVQPGSPCYCCDYGLHELRKAVASAVRGKAAERRDYWIAHLHELHGANPDRNHIVQLQRKLNAVE